MAQDNSDSQTLDIFTNQENFLTAEEIKKLVKDRGMTMTELAKMLKIGPEYLSRLVNNIDKRKDNPQWEYALRRLLGA